LNIILLFCVAKIDVLALSYFVIFHFSLLRAKSFWLTKAAQRGTQSAREMMESIVVVVAGVLVLCRSHELWRGTKKYYYILIGVVGVAVIRWMDENNFHNIIENNLNALFTFFLFSLNASNRSEILFFSISKNFDYIENFCLLLL
jgi:xanthine/uracil permease